MFIKRVYLDETPIRLTNLKKIIIFTKIGIKDNKIGGLIYGI